MFPAVQRLELSGQVGRGDLLAHVLERLEVGEVGLEGLVGNTPRQQSTADVRRLPSEVEIEIADGGCHRWPGRVVQNNQPAWPNELSKKVQVHEDFMKAMAAIDKRGIGLELIACKTCERDRRWLGNQGGLSGQIGGNQGVPPNVVVRRGLKRIDDDVSHVGSADRTECLTDRQRRASVREAHFNDDVSAVADERVT
jgi:hypothetical protein